MNYSELKTLIDAYVNRNGVQAITGSILNGVLNEMVDQLGRGYQIMGVAEPTDDPGLPDGPECWFAGNPGTYTNFGGITVVDGEIALLCFDTGWTKRVFFDGFADVEASVDSSVGTPTASVSYEEGTLTFTFSNLKGDQGNPAEVGDVTASVDNTTGTPEVTVTTSGPDTAKNIDFDFKHLKGETGAAAGFGNVSATVDGNVGTPSVSVLATGPDTAKEISFDFKNLKGEQGAPGTVAAFNSILATVDDNVGTPGVDVLSSGPDTAKDITFRFTNLKGEQGEQGEQGVPGEQGEPGTPGLPGEPGAAAGFGTVTASVGNNSGIPTVEVLTSGPDTAKNFRFRFTNMKGDQGERGIQGEQGIQGPQGEQGEQGPEGPAGVQSAAVSVDNSTGVPSASVTLQNGVLSISFHNLKGEQGNTGSSVDYPFTIVNNLTTDDATQALSSAMGVRLDEKITELGLDDVNLNEYEAVMTIPSGNNKWVTDNLSYPYMGIFIQVNGGQTVELVNTPDKDVKYCFLTSPYYENNTNVSYATGYSGNGANTPLGGGFVTAPSDATYLYIRVSNDGLETYIGPTRVGLVKSFDAIADEAVEGLADEVDVMINGEKVNITKGKYLFSNGNTYSSSDWCYMNDYVPIKQYDMIDWNPGGTKNDACLVIYNSSKEVVGYRVANETHRTVEVTYAAAAYVRASFAISGLNNARLLVNSKIAWTPIQTDTDGIIDNIEEIKKDALFVAKYNRAEYYPDYIDNTGYQSSYPRLDLTSIVSPAIPVSVGDKIELTASAYIAQFKSDGTIKYNTNTDSLTISDSTVKYVRVPIPKATEGYTVSLNGLVVLQWSSDLYEAIVTEEQADAIEHSSLQEAGIYSFFPAVFNGTVGNPGNASRIRTEIIKTIPGSTVRVRPNVSLPAGYTYAFGYETRESDGTANRSGSISVSSVGNQEIRLTWREHYVYFEIAAYDETNTAYALRASSYQDILDIVIEYPVNTIDVRKYKQLLANTIFSPSQIPARQSSPLVLVHFSDNHGDAANYKRVVAFRDGLRSYIDDVISTGDNVSNSWADDFSYWTNREVLNVIGNHDTALYSGGTYDWTYYAGKDAYDRYFSPFISFWNVTQPADAETEGYCYYYKDYPTHTIRLIVLDVMGWDEQQLTWLSSILSDAVSQNLSVVIAIHGPANVDSVTPMETGWMTYFGWSVSSDVIPDDAVAAVDGFIEEGGRFISWICGHTHKDQVGYMSEHHNQLCIVVGTASSENPQTGYGDCARLYYTDSQDLFNVISFDAKELQVRVVRVGASVNKQFQTRRFLVIGFSEDGSTPPVVVRSE